MLLTVALLSLLHIAPAIAAPVVDAMAEGQAARIARQPDADPMGRVNQLLDAWELSEGALFVLATTDPAVVEAILSDELRPAGAYLQVLPAPELHRIRRGETVIRTVDAMRRAELLMASRLAEDLGFKAKKLLAVRTGPLEGRVFRVEVTTKGKRGQQDRAHIDILWPPTPERDEASRNVLAKKFGARPSRIARGVGSMLPLRDSSFEAAAPLQDAWLVGRGVNLGSDQPFGDVSLDPTKALDGRQSIRFYADEKPRLFPLVTQRVAVPSGATIRVRTQQMAERLRTEYQQRSSDVYLSVTFGDAQGQPVSTPAKAHARLATHAWEPLEVVASTPPGAAYLVVGLSSAVSGSSWFDAVTVEHLR